MTAITVHLPTDSYDVVISPGSLDHLGASLKPVLSGPRLLLVSNPTVFEHYGARAIAALEAAGFAVARCLLPDGEAYKTPDSIQTLYDAALAHKIERSSTLLSLGGGVIGDMTGFAAATWLRGVRFVQVPTSLLAMVDASVGGKTGVNHPQGKNLIGAFHQPRQVVIDPEVLATLPLREFRAGMAEVIKYGIIWDADLFEHLEAAPSLQPDMSPELLQMILMRSCQAKAEVVSKDEKEAGLRAILNYGHTIGHAVESLTGYRSVNHGEAVAIGMVAAGAIAVELGYWERAVAERQNRLIELAGLPTVIPSLDSDAVIAALQADKKVKQGRVRFVLPTTLGAATLVDQVPEDVIRHVLQKAVAV
ncbi:MAG: 3-dehydroquinate synthase [Elainellaceae cyanobacterium]